MRNKENMFPIRTLIWRHGRDMGRYLLIPDLLLLNVTVEKLPQSR